MEESGVFEYWFAFLFALGFCVWFPTYVVKTKGQGISTWGLALCIVFLFIGLPLLSISLILRCSSFSVAELYQRQLRVSEHIAALRNHS